MGSTYNWGFLGAHLVPFFSLRLVVFRGCQALSTLGFSVDASDNDDTKPLHLAARFGHAAVVAKLLGATKKNEKYDLKGKKDVARKEEMSSLAESHILFFGEVFRGEVVLMFA